MPGTNTGNLPETLVGLTGEASDTPAGNDTFEALPFGNGNGVDHLVLLEHCVDGHRLLEPVADPLDLVTDRTTVDLDLHDVGLLLAQVELVDLGVGDCADHSAVLGDLGALSIDGSTTVFGPLALVVLESPLGLGLVPVLVEAAAALLVEVIGPDGSDGAEPAGGLDVPDHTDDHHRRALQDGAGPAHLLLVCL